jgi:nitroimidazol reductase NimA-like FMN-containing flavoprotein (pyridoxamine 5'-phosphate oxidase superfamily)
MTAVDEHRHELAEMSSEECYERLRSQLVGRLAFDSAQGITVLPVNYVLRGHDVVIATTAFGVVAREAHGRVAFEIDELHADRHLGWSVLVQGSVAHDDEETLGGEHRSAAPQPWPDGVRNLRLVITPTAISGRRLGAGDQ